MATNIDVYLYQGEAAPRDVRLRTLALQNVSIYTTDSCTIALADPSDAIHNGEEWAVISFAAIAVSDSLAVGADDQWRTVIGTEVAGTGIAFTHWEVPDPLPLSMTDTAWPGNTIVVLGLDDSAQPFILVTQPTTDTCTVQLTEALPLLLWTWPVVDSLAVQASDATPVIVAVLSTSDSCTVQASEGAIGIVSTVSATGDSTTVQASEAILINSTVSMSDSAGVTGSDLVSILVTGATTDTETVGLTEGSASIFASTFCSDTDAIQASEATPNVVQLSLISATDTCTIQTSESTPLIGQVFLVADSLAIQAADVVQTGPLALATTDSLAIQTTEALTNSLPTSTSEVLAQPAIDMASILVVQALTDAIALPISEVATQQVSGAATPITASDSCALPIIDEIEPLRTFAVSDTCAVPIDEHIAALAIPAELVALMLIEEVRLEITWLEVIWGGGSRTEDAGKYLYAGSYRMGPRNADETRGTEY